MKNHPFHIPEDDIKSYPCPDCGGIVSLGEDLAGWECDNCNFYAPGSSNTASNTVVPDSARSEADEYKHWFKEVMAIMHRDGGHYLAEHGIEKSARDAISNYHRFHELCDKNILCLKSLLENKDIMEIALNNDDIWPFVIQDIIKNNKEE